MIRPGLFFFFHMIACIFSFQTRELVLVVFIKHVLIFINVHVQFSIYLLHLPLPNPYARSRNLFFLLKSHHDGSIFFLYEKHFFKRVMILHSVHVCAVFTCIYLHIFSHLFLHIFSFVLYYYYLCFF